MNAIVAAITKAKGRKSLFHFTRASNLLAIAHLDMLLSSTTIHPHDSGERRLEARNVNFHEYSITINAHLKIVDSMMDAATSQEQFRACLDRHVFLWPTLKDCQKMIQTYARREPNERFAVLEFDAYSLLLEHYSAVRLSKYDSGSSPRYPAHCSYKKSPDMFLPLECFKTIISNTVPAKASEIREVLIEDRVMGVSKHLRTVYIDNREDMPEFWRSLMKPLANLQVTV
ncbi:hypothetical protein SAMN03159341_11958 [Paenibacillus sp. 1_12]|uniref:DUF7002 family protein n=1 Tax=Paenibacillus sp. 1_12 TaxID=1566278 RepID=UPI0008EBEEA4|nr:hypothetical protein [Paenibacillus sp. 1_12]SFM17884.1 hypothetical protein SAMN03159341_11958 [Paenibacillus sp. 1_12]